MISNFPGSRRVDRKIGKLTERDLDRQIASKRDRDPHRVVGFMLLPVLVSLVVALVARWI